MGTPRALLGSAAFAAFAVSGALAATGCAGEVVASSDASTAATYAFLAVDRVAPASSPDAARAHATARFLRVADGADARLAARLVGGSAEVPALGTCVAQGALADRAMPLASLGPVDLVPAGEVTVEAAGARATLAARAFPDVVDLVSGLFYTTRDAAAEPLPAGVSYRFTATGSAALAALAIDAEAPPAPDQLRVGGDAVTGDDAIAVAADDLALAWRPGAPRDLVYVDLVSMDDDARGRVRCAFADGGEAVVPREALPAGQVIALALHRVHREVLAARGLAGGEVQFDVATTLSLRVAW